MGPESGRSRRDGWISAGRVRARFAPRGTGVLREPFWEVGILWNVLRSVTLLPRGSPLWVGGTGRAGREHCSDVHEHVFTVHCSRYHGHGTVHTDPYLGPGSGRACKNTECALYRHDRAHQKHKFLYNSENHNKTFTSLRISETTTIKHWTSSSILEACITNGEHVFISI